MSVTTGVSLPLVISILPTPYTTIRVYLIPMLITSLTGSERMSKSGVTGQAMKETQHINKSLSALGDVMEGLDKKAKHIPFRNSKLTYLLQVPFVQYLSAVLLCAVLIYTLLCPDLALFYNRSGLVGWKFENDDDCHRMPDGAYRGRDLIRVAGEFLVLCTLYRYSYECYAFRSLRQGPGTFN